MDGAPASIERACARSRTTLRSILPVNLSGLPLPERYALRGLSHGCQLMRAWQELRLC